MNANPNTDNLPVEALNLKEILRPLFDARIKCHTAYQDMVARFGPNKVTIGDVKGHFFFFRQERFLAQLKIKQELPMDSIIINKMSGEEQLYAENTDEDIDILTPDARSKAEELVPELILNEFDNESIRNVDVKISRTGIVIHHGKQYIAKLIRCDEGSIIVKADGTRENYHCNQYDLAIAILARVFEKTTISIRILGIEANAYSLSMEQKISWKTFLTALRACRDILGQVQYLRFGSCHLVQYDIAKQVFKFRYEDFHVMTHGRFYQRVVKLSDGIELARQRNSFIDRYQIYAKV